MNPTSTPNNDCGAIDTNCDTTDLTRGLEDLDIGHIDAESVETRAVTERALEQLTHDTRLTLMLARKKMCEEEMEVTITRLKNLCSKPPSSLAVVASSAHPRRMSWSLASPRVASIRNSWSG